MELSVVKKYALASLTSHRFSSRPKALLGTICARLSRRLGIWALRLTNQNSALICLTDRKCDYLVLITSTRFAESIWTDLFSTNTLPLTPESSPSSHLH